MARLRPVNKLYLSCNCIGKIIKCNLLFKKLSCTFYDKIFKKKKNLLLLFLPNVKNKYLMKVNKTLFKNRLARFVLSNFKL